jgi:hypothetical protein
MQLQGKLLTLIAQCGEEGRRINHSSENVLIAAIAAATAAIATATPSPHM